MLTDPYDGPVACLRKYGDPMTYPGFGSRFFVTANPDAIKTILTAEPETFQPTFTDTLGTFVGPGSLFMMSGATHRAARKLLAPPFHGARMRAYGTLMRDTTRRYIQKWEPGRRFAMQDTTQAITLDIIVEAIFGVTGEERIRRFHEAIVSTVESVSPFLVMFKFLRHDFGGHGPWARYQRHSAVLRQLVAEEIAAHRAAPEGQKDILSLLLLSRYDDGSGLSEGELFDQLFTLMMAGHETTAIALAWACYYLHRNPATLSRLRAELSTLGPSPEPELVAKLPYLEAVCDEVLRLRPMPILARMLARPLTVAGYDLPAGMMLGCATYAAHQRPDVYPTPEAFRPERFLGRTYSPFEYLPFGGGARRCIGSAFALYEMKIVLATMLAEHHLELAEPGPVKTVYRAATVGPRGGIRMSLQERRG